MKKWFGIGSKKRKESSTSDTARTAADQHIPTTNSNRPSGNSATVLQSSKAKDGSSRENKACTSSTATSAEKSASNQGDGQHIRKSVKSDSKSKDWNLSSSSGSDRQSISSAEGDLFATKLSRFESLPTANFSDQSEKLESLITDAMDYLANEGLVYPRLFRDTLSRSQSDALIDATLKNGNSIDFIACNDASLAAGVLLAAISRFRTPIFPTSMFDLLVSTWESSQRVDPDKKYLVWKNIITDAMTQHSMSPIFLNLLGLFHLILEHTLENNVSAELMELHFAPFFLSSKSHLSTTEMQTHLLTAGKILGELTSHIYKIFPDKVLFNPILQ